jgi:methyl-accepting chemotaxis protein
MFGFLKRISLKVKLVSFIGITVLISISTVSTVSFIKSKQALNELTENQLRSSGLSIKHSLDWFLNRTRNFTSILSRDRLVEGLLIAYESSFFGSNFDPGKDLKIDNRFYQKLDGIYGERKKKILEEYELTDLLLVSLDSQVIFTANNSQKKLFLGKNLTNGTFKGSPLFNCYKKAINSKSGSLIFSGFNYSKITDSVNGFICGKKKAEFSNQDEGIDKGDDIGVIITQINNSIINKMLTSRTGMGKTGQSYLVGDDFLLRSDFFINSKKFNAINSMKNGIEVDVESVKLALNGKSGNIYNINPNGKDVLAAYQPFPFMGISFAIITEKEYEEIFDSVMSPLTFII